MVCLACEFARFGVSLNLSLCSSKLAVSRSQGSKFLSMNWIALVSCFSWVRNRYVPVVSDACVASIA